MSTFVGGSLPNRWAGTELAQVIWPLEIPGAEGWQQTPGVCTHFGSLLSFEPSPGVKWQQKPDVSAHIGKRLPLEGGGGRLTADRSGKHLRAVPARDLARKSLARSAHTGSLPPGTGPSFFSTSPLPAQTPRGRGTPPAAVPERCSRGASAAKGDDKRKPDGKDLPTIARHRHVHPIYELFRAARRT